MSGSRPALKYMLTWGALSVCCLYLVGCLELIRRSPAKGVEQGSAFTSVQTREDGTAAADAGGKEEVGPAAEPDTSGSEVVEGLRAAEDSPGITVQDQDTVQDKEKGPAEGDHLSSAPGGKAGEPAASGEQGVQGSAGGAAMDLGKAGELKESPEASGSGPVIEGPAPVAAKAEKVRHTRRSRSRRQEVRQVNEYAFWCLEKGLWNEARLHLEQAVERDSLAASLHNNLGIIYERMGLEEKALAAYGKAWDLSPREKAYRDNLEKLKRRRRAIPDSAVRIDIIELDDQAEQGPASGSPAEARQSILAGG